MTQLFVDMDGVLADFDAHHETVFGVRACKKVDNVDWAAVRAIQDFYLNIPPMPDMEELWAHVEQFDPTVLTGVPSSVPEAVHNKCSWVRKNLGDRVGVICCPSREKSNYLTPGDILIDDWEKYRDLWIGKGGRWITHTSASNTIRQLSEMGF